MQFLSGILSQYDLHERVSHTAYKRSLFTVYVVFKPLSSFPTNFSPVISGAFKTALRCWLSLVMYTCARALSSLAPAIYKKSLDIPPSEWQKYQAPSKIGAGLVLIPSQCEHPASDLKTFPIYKSASVTSTLSAIVCELVLTYHFSLRVKTSGPLPSWPNRSRWTRRIERTTCQPQQYNCHQFPSTIALQQTIPRCILKPQRQCHKIITRRSKRQSHA